MPGGIRLRFFMARRRILTVAMVTLLVMAGIWGGAYIKNVRKQTAEASDKDRADLARGACLVTLNKAESEVQGLDLDRPSSWSAEVLADSCIRITLTGRTKIDSHTTIESSWDCVALPGPDAVDIVSFARLDQRESAPKDGSIRE
jgi:hypothetical protein